MCQQFNLKKKLSKQGQRQNHRYGEHFDGCQMAGGCGSMSEKVRGLRSKNWLFTEQAGGCKVQYRKWSSQRTYTHDP